MSNNEIKTVLVTGGAGYIGSVLCPKLLKHNYKVIVYDCLFYGNSGLKSILNHPNFTLIQGDIRDIESLSKTLSNVDCVIHLAAISNDPSAELDTEITRQVNYLAYQPLIDACKAQGVKRFINSSSIGVYGINYDNNVTEDEPLNPITEYAKCKALTEEIVRQSASSDFTAVSLRCGTVCGWSPRMRFDLSVNTLTAIALQNNELTVWGGDQRRPQIYIEDVTDFFVALLTIDSAKINGRIFNAAGHNYKISDLSLAIKEVLGGNMVLKQMPPRADERSYHVNSDRIKNELGLAPKHDIKDAIISIYNAYKEKLWSDYTSADYNNVKKITSTI